MGETTIEWTDVTWNPVRGCSLVSEGCRNCYAMRQAHRFGGPGGPYEGLTRLTPTGPKWTGRVRMVDEVMDQPLRWRKPRRVFVNSMSDLFHQGVQVPFIAEVFAVMAAAERHQFQLLTKRAEVMAETLASEQFQDAYSLEWETLTNQGVAPWPIPNLWIGVSVEDQAAVVSRVPALIATPAAVRFVSAEPLLGAVDLLPWLDPAGGYLDWVIVGGESGPGARPMDLGWVRALREQCTGTQTAFFFKQWGGVRKKEAGRELDGRTWSEFPEASNG